MTHNKQLPDRNIYENYTVRIANYAFAKPTLLAGSGGLMGIATGQRLSDGLSVVVKLSPHIIRLEREYYIARRLCLQPEGKKYIPQVIELVALPQDNLVALIYADIPGRDHDTETVMDIHSFLHFAIQACACLQFLHANGIVHGELRPSAFCGSHNMVKIWNFGAGLKSEEILLSTSGWRWAVTDRRDDSPPWQNTLVYVSPEQTGRTSNVLDHRTDLYSLGILFFVVLTGQTPFDGTLINIIQATLSTSIPLVHMLRPDIPPVISLIIDKLTRKTVDERYNSAYGVSEDLVECQRRLASEPPDCLEFFPLALHDVNSVFQFPSNLFGRDAEIGLIRSAIRRLNSVDLDENGNPPDPATQRMRASPMDKTNCEVVIITGPGGIGKSSLVSAVHSHARHYGYLAVSKFDSMQKRPYHGLLRCLSSLLRQLLTEPEAVIQEFYKDLRQQLGPHFSNVRMLIDMVPELKPILSDNERNMHDDCVRSGINAESRFHALFINVVRTITWRKTVTLCLDDIQEADDPSTLLIRSLIASRMKILIIMTCRDDTKLAQCIRDELEDATVTTLKPVPLDIDAITQFVTATLHRSARDVQPLAEMIFHRSHGNPFYAKQLMIMMKRKGHIWFDWDEKQWKYTLDGTLYITGEMSALDAHESVLDVRDIVSFLKDIDPQAQTMLKWASLFGNAFDCRHIGSLMASDNQTIMAGLQLAVQDGIIQSKAGNEYQFIHDRYCQAASMLIEDDKVRQEMHLKIGETLMSDEKTDVFLAADHLIKSASLIRQLPSGGSRYRQVLIRAGDEAVISGAQQMACAYYECAMSLLPEDDAWNESETLELHMKMAELHWWIGQRQEANRLLDIVMQHTIHRPVDRANARRIQAKMHFHQQKHRQGIEAIRNALRELGVDDIQEQDGELLPTYHQVKRQILEVGWDDLYHQPLCKDDRTLAIMGLFNEACIGAYWYNPLLVDFFAIKLVQLSLEQGYGSASGGGFVWMGITAAKLGEYAFGARLGQMGLTINEKHAGNSEIAQSIVVYHSTLGPWMGFSHRESMEHMFAAYKHATAAGDRIYASMSLFYTCAAHYYSGTHLMVLQELLSEGMDDCSRNYGDDVRGKTLNMSLLLSVLTLQGNTDALGDKAPSFMTDQECESVDSLSSKNSDPEILLRCTEIVTLMHFSKYSEAVELGFRILDTSSSYACHRHVAIAMFYHTLALIACVRDTQLEDDTHTRYLGQVQANIRSLGEWASHSEINYRMCHHLVNAELATLNNNYPLASRLYNDAIELGMQDDQTSFLALTYRLAAENYMRLGMSMLAMPMLHQSLEFYNAWGAHSVAQHVSDKYPSVFAKRGVIRKTAEASVQTEDTYHFPAPTDNNNGSIVWQNILPEPPQSEQLSGEESFASDTAILSLDIVDLTSIIKSSQVISNEMNSFEELLTKMMGIVMANSAAESGAIIIKEGVFGVAAHATRSGCETFEPPMPLTNDKGLVSSLIIYYVIHTQTTLFIPDVRKDTRFAAGTWYANSGPKSVICMPIRHTNTLVGVLYVQADLNTFTHKHVTVLHILCHQIGISITNALLFKSVQRAKQMNAQMLISQQETLEEARKSREQALKAMKLKSNFLANISHELRTPFAGVYGMIVLLSETQLDSDQREFVVIAKQSCEMLLQIVDDLLDFSKLEARKVKLHCGLFYVEDLIEDRMELLMTLASNKNIEMTYFADENVPDMVFGDVNRIGQILMNLIGNAIKFTQVGEVIVRCGVQDRSSVNPPLADDEIMLKFSVEDTGIGIAPEDLKSLFLPFSQVDGSTTRNFGGTGLGLSICLEIVRLMGGDIWVESRENVGSTFHFCVRVHKASSVTEAAVDSSQRAQEIDRLNDMIGQLRLLVHTSSRQAAMIESLLPNVLLQHVNSIEEGFECAKLAETNDQPFDCMIADPSTPEAMQQLLDALDDYNQRPNQKLLPVILLYAFVTDNTRRQILVGNQYTERQQQIFDSQVYRITKPVRRLNLLSTLVKVMNMESPTENQASSSLASAHRLRMASNGNHATLNMGRSPDQLEIKPSYSSPFSSQRGCEGFSPEELATFQGQKILVAEDNPLAQILIVKQLERVGFIVEACKNGFECIETWQKRGPNYFLLAWIDNHMPQCDGLEATRKIRQLEREMGVESPLPIIALTADKQKTAQQKCIEAGMNDFIVKPLLTKNLVAILRRYCLSVHSSIPSSITQTNHIQHPHKSIPTELSS